MRVQEYLDLSKENDKWENIRLLYLCSGGLVKLDQLIVEVEGIDSKSKIKVVR
jgi:hypothetical protein